MTEVISRVAKRVGLPGWWVESVAIEYLNCRAFATTGALWKFQFDQLTDDELADAATRHHVIMRGYLLHNVWPEFISADLVRTLVGTYSESPAQGPGDVLPIGRASNHCFMEAGNDINVEDPKLVVPLGFFQVRDDDAFWQWQFASLDGGSSIVDLEPLREVERVYRQLQGQSAGRSLVSTSDFLGGARDLCEQAERARTTIRETLWQYHVRMKPTATMDKVVRGQPPMLSFMETLRVRGGEIETQFAAEPAFYRASLRFVDEARSCTQLDELHEKRTGAIIMAAACLEAYINRALDLTHPELFKSVERLPLPSKWHLLLTLSNHQDKWDVSSEPIATLRRLQASRNALMHFKRGFKPVVRTTQVALSHLDGMVLEENLVFSIPGRIKELVKLASSAMGVDAPRWLESSSAWELPPEESDTRPSVRRIGTLPQRARTMKVSGKITVGPKASGKDQPGSPGNATDDSRHQGGA